MAPPKQRPWKRYVFLAALVIAGGIYRMNSAPSTSHSQIFQVSPGASAGQVASALRKDDQIRSRLWFLVLARATNAPTRIQAGSFQIFPGRTSYGILRDMVTGRSRRARVTIPEGFASWQIAERLESLNVCKADGFRAAVAQEKAEGFLFPDTYYFQENTPPRRVLDLMAGRFREVWKEVAGASSSTVDAGSLASLQNQTVPLPDGRLWTCLRAVTLASLIEREAQRPEERPLISAVYHNRLNKRMPLESDPTVQFSLGFWKDRIFFKDLETPSPYNTYRHFGLPPGPICSPGKESIKSALQPVPADYLYFVADEKGGHKFTSSYEDHLREVRRRNRERRMKDQTPG